jgi:hypothetical protein
MNIMVIAIFSLPKKCKFCHFYIHTSVVVATCATRQKGKMNVVGEGLVKFQILVNIDN